MLIGNLLIWELFPKLKCLQNIFFCDTCNKQGKTAPFPSLFPVNSLVSMALSMQRTWVQFPEKMYKMQSNTGYCKWLNSLQQEFNKVLETIHRDYSQCWQDLQLPLWGSPLLETGRHVHWTSLKWHALCLHKRFYRKHYAIRGCADWQPYASRLCYSNNAQFLLRHFHQPDPLTQGKTDLQIYVVKPDVLFCCYSPSSSRQNVLCRRECLNAQHVTSCYFRYFIFLSAWTRLPTLLQPHLLTRTFHPQNCPLMGCFLVFTPPSGNSRDCCVWKSQEICSSRDNVTQSGTYNHFKV